MPEREPQTSERVNLHELGGLTHDHWGKIPGGNPLLDAFAKAVLNGRIDPSGFSHREYLGRRTWEWVHKQLESKLRLPGFKFLSPADEKIQQEIIEFAERERKAHANLNDFILPILNTPILGENDRQLAFEDNSWHILVADWENVEGIIQLAGILDAGEASDEELSVLLEHYYLNPDEVPDLLHTDEHELIEILQTRIPINTLKGRIVKRQRDNSLSLPQSIGGWEKSLNPKITKYGTQKRKNVRDGPQKA